MLAAMSNRELQDIGITASKPAVRPTSRFGAHDTQANSSGRAARQRLLPSWKSVLGLKGAGFLSVF
jgi:hypothetical protein